jgi:hypothetical protein
MTCPGCGLFQLKVTATWYGAMGPLELALCPCGNRYWRYEGGEWVACHVNMPEVSHD